MEELEERAGEGWWEKRGKSAERDRKRREREWEEEGWELIQITWEEREKDGMQCGNMECKQMEWVGLKGEDLRMEKVSDFELEFGRSELFYMEDDGNYGDHSRDADQTGDLPGVEPKAGAAAGGLMEEISESSKREGEVKMMSHDLGLRRKKKDEKEERIFRRKPLRGKRRGKKLKEKEKDEDEDRRNTIVMLAYLHSKSTNLCLP